MGYYIEILESTAAVKGKYLEEAYKAACDLNKRDDLKRGGSYHSGKKTASWFSWMDENYPETCKNVQEILEQLGFDTRKKDGDILITGYDNKSGQEELFLKTLAPYMDGAIVWQGEENERWKHTFKDGNLVEEPIDTSYL